MTNTYWNNNAYIWSSEGYKEGLAIETRSAVREYCRENVQRMNIPIEGVMDLASGAHPEYLWGLVNFNNLIAVDFSPEMLALNPAGVKLEADLNTEEGVRFLDATIADGSLSLVTCFFGMRYTQQQVSLTEICAKKLKPGGKLFFIDYYELSHQESKGVFDPMALVRSPLSSRLRLLDCYTEDDEIVVTATTWDEIDILYVLSVTKKLAR